MKFINSELSEYKKQLIEFTQYFTVFFYFYSNDAVSLLLRLSAMLIAKQLIAQKLTDLLMQLIELFTVLTYVERNSNTM